MTKSILELMIASLIGSLITVGGVVLKMDDVIKSAESSVNKADVHQLATVLELYYSDHQTYPQAQNGEELIKELSREGYIRSQPFDASLFHYKSLDAGQDYSLSLPD